MAAPNLMPTPTPIIGEGAAEQAAKPLLRVIQGGLEAAPEVAETAEVVEGAAILAPEVVIPLVIVGVVVVGLIALGVYLYKKSEEQPDPPKAVPPCPLAPPAPAPAPAPAPPRALSDPPAQGSAKKVPVKPADLSKEESDHWEECKEKHDEYKKLQTESGKRSSTIKDIKRRLGTGQPVSPAEMQEFCRFLGEQLGLAKQEIASRQDYIDSGCDKYDWFDKGKTEQDRKTAHEGQVNQTEQQVKNLEDAREKYCPGETPPPNQGGNEDGLPNS